MPSLQYMESEDEEDRDYSPEGLHLQHIDDEEAEEPVGTAGKAIESVPKGDAQIIFDLDDFPDDKIFSTKQVAVLCELNGPQDVRNLLAVWDAVIKVDRDENNRALWKKSHVEQMREMLAIKKERNFTVNDVLKFYTTAADEDANVLAVPAAGAENELAEVYAKVLSKTFKETLAQKTDELRENDARILEEIEKSKQQNNESMQAVLELIKNLQEGQNALKEEQKARDEEIRKLREENESLKTSLEESKKKKSLFGFLK